MCVVREVVCVQQGWVPTVSEATRTVALLVTVWGGRIALPSGGWPMRFDLKRFGCQ